MELQIHCLILNKIDKLLTQYSNLTHNTLTP